MSSVVKEACMHCKYVDVLVESACDWCLRTMPMRESLFCRRYTTTPESSPEEIHKFRAYYAKTQRNFMATDDDTHAMIKIEISRGYLDRDAVLAAGYDLDHEPPDSPSFGSEHWL